MLVIEGRPRPRLTVVALDREGDRLEKLRWQLLKPCGRLYVVVGERTASWTVVDGKGCESTRRSSVLSSKSSSASLTCSDSDARRSLKKTVDPSKSVCARRGASDGTVVVCKFTAEGVDVKVVSPKLTGAQFFFFFHGRDSLNTTQQ